MEQTTSFMLNGKPASVTTDNERMLLWVLRSDLGFTGTKFGCGEAHCGACTVMVDGEAVRSCVTALNEVAGKKVLTIEGLASDGHPNALQEAFIKHSAFQCGFCTPGMVMNAYALLLKTPTAKREEIIREMDGNLCRCGAHVRILAAIEEAGVAMQGGAR
jgi:aerobic-type carbon monoxide dehydrogenase small subunit (CoxS/CutS family)